MRLLCTFWDNGMRLSLFENCYFIYFADCYTPAIGPLSSSLRALRGYADVGRPCASPPYPFVHVFLSWPLASQRFSMLGSVRSDHGSWASGSRRAQQQGRQPPPPRPPSLAFSLSFPPLCSFPQLEPAAPLRITRPHGTDLASALMTRIRGLLVTDLRLPGNHRACAARCATAPVAVVPAAAAAAAIAVTAATATTPEAAATAAAAAVAVEVAAAVAAAAAAAPAAATPRPIALPGEHWLDADATPTVLQSGGRASPTSIDADIRSRRPPRQHPGRLPRLSSSRNPPTQPARLPRYPRSRAWPPLRSRRLRPARAAFTGLPLNRLARQVSCRSACSSVSCLIGAVRRYQGGSCRVTLALRRGRWP